MIDLEQAERDGVISGGFAKTVADEIARLRAENTRLREALEAIRCNTEANTFNTICFLPDDGPHSISEHYGQHLLAVNDAARAALAGKEDVE